MQTIEEKLGLTELLPPPKQEEPEKFHFEEIALDINQVQEAAKNSLDFLAALALPTVFRYLFPTVFKAIWAWLLQYVHKVRDFSQLVIGLPRGFGKTMLIKVFCLYCIIFTKKQFILIVCGTQTKANNIVSDIQGMLDEANVKKVFGDWRVGLRVDRQDLKRFGFRGRNIIIMAAGAGSDIRGITVDNERPDVMIFDDIQTREESESEQISTAIETWLYGTAMKAKSPHGCLFIFIANMYPTKWSLLRRLKTNPTWDKFIAGGILADGTSLWEELQPIEQLLKEFERDLISGRPEIFYSEVLNDETASTNFLIDISKLPAYPFEEEMHQGNFVVIDPATHKLGADNVSVGYFEVYNSTPTLKDVVEERMSPGQTIETALTFCLKHNCRAVAIESNSYQYTLNYWFNYICMQRGITGIQALEVYSGMISKPSRILSMFKELVAGELFVHKKAQAVTYSQITEYKPLRRDNVDGILDLLTYAKKVIATYPEAILGGLTIEMQDYAGMQIYDESVTSSF